MVTEPTRRLFTVDEYHRMAEAGILNEDDRVELLDGEIIQLTPIGPHHAGCVNRLNRLLVEGLRGRAVVTPQNPAVLDVRSEPQPDLCVARARDDDYESAHPAPHDLLLAIEVADTSILYDRNRKAPKYASSGIRELWILDLKADRLEVYREPGPDGYGERLIFAPGDSVAPSAFPDITLDVGDVLSRRR